MVRLPDFKTSVGSGTGGDGSPGGGEEGVAFSMRAQVR